MTTQRIARKKKSVPSGVVFARYYVKHSYADPELEENPPPELDLSKIVRSIDMVSAGSSRRSGR